MPLIVIFFLIIAAIFFIGAWLAASGSAPGRRIGGSSGKISRYDPAGILDDDD